MFLTKRFYLAAAALALLLAAGHFVPVLFDVGKALLALLGLLVLVETLMLYSSRRMHASRLCSDRFSNGDDNEVRLRIESSYPFPLHLQVIDETPFIFQRRDVSYPLQLKAREGKTIVYTLLPTRRGVYDFGRIRVFASTLTRLVERRFTEGEPKSVAVYPSFLRLRRYEIMAISDNLTEQGAKRIRRPGNHTEFEHIQYYVPGDDYRDINWKATARRHQLMVNVWQEEKSQRIYCLIDKGRVMQQAFGGMTLLDYSINAALALSFVAIRKQDNAGLVTFCEHVDTFVRPERHRRHLQDIQESLYAQQTTFSETDYAALCTMLDRELSRRSLLVLFTSFGSITAMQRQLPYLRQMARRHCLLVVFFEDEDLRAFAHSAHPARLSTEEIYQHTIAEKIEYEKRLIVASLRQQGIRALLTTPGALSVNVINSYLDLKSRHAF